MSDDVAKFVLPPTMRLDDCRDLETFLRSNAECPVALIGDQVGKLGGQAAQLIVAHHKYRQQSGQPMDILDGSDGLHASLQALGLQHILGGEGQAL